VTEKKKEVGCLARVSRSIEKNSALKEKGKRKKFFLERRWGKGGEKKSPGWVNRKYSDGEREGGQVGFP